VQCLFKHLLKSFCETEESVSTSKTFEKILLKSHRRVERKREREGERERDVINGILGDLYKRKVFEYIQEFKNCFPFFLLYWELDFYV
jgi:hypothetical protein